MFGQSINWLRVLDAGVPGVISGNFSSCKFFGDSLRLCGSLLGEPQLLPLLIEFDHFEDAKGFAACRTPTHPLVLLACPNDLIDPFFHPATANGFAYPLTAAVIDDLRLMPLEVGDERLQLLGVFGAHSGLEVCEGSVRATV